MENGLVSPSVEGTPQGGPLSPLLSNLVLDEFDRELEGRGHRFVRYADDSNIYVRSERTMPRSRILSGSETAIGGLAALPNGKVRAPGARRPPSQDRLCARLRDLGRRRETQQRVVGKSRFRESKLI